MPDNRRKIEYLKSRIEAVEGWHNEKWYRASAYLKDGTFLPCVIFSNPHHVIKKAIAEIELAKQGKILYNNSPELGFQLTVKQFISFQNRVNFYVIAKIVQSRFAFPVNILNQIKGETTMGWTGFSARMSDGRFFGFGTTV
jgi:hypothetical protein